MAIIPIIFFALLFGLRSGFGGGGTVTQEAVPEPSAAVSAASPASGSDLRLPPKLVRAMFDNRETLPTCTSWQCLQGAADQEGAELVRTETTDEGAPVTRYFRVEPGGQYEIFTDNSQDSFRGDPAWTYDVCAVPAEVREGCPG